MTCRFAIDDGAYVLGALAPAERAEFERHLPSCPSCREAVAALAVIPGLLRRLDAETAFATAAAPPSIVPRALAAVVSRRRTERRRRVWYAVAAGLASVCLAAAVGVGVHLVDAAGTPRVPAAALTAMQPASRPVPISAEVGLVAADGGTWVQMRCRYQSAYKGTWPVRLVVYPRSGGGAEQIGTWMATSGREVSLTALTHLAPGEIGRVELQAEDETPLLTWAPS